MERGQPQDDVVGGDYVEELLEEYRLAVPSKTSADAFDSADEDAVFIPVSSTESSVHHHIGGGQAKSGKKEETRESVGGASAVIVDEEDDILDEVVSSATAKKTETMKEYAVMAHGDETAKRRGRHSGGVTKKVGSEKCLGCESKEKAKESLEEQFVVNPKSR